MNIVDFLRVTNIIIALISLPPTFLLLKNLYRESKKTGDRKSLHRMLRNMFLMFAFISIFNALISFLLFIRFDFTLIFGETLGMTIFNVRNIAINLSVCSISWGIYFFLRRIKVV